MKSLLVAFTAFTLIVLSCKTSKPGNAVYSITTIDARKSFVLGENEHDAFEVALKNISKYDLELSQLPNGGTKQLIQILPPGKSAIVKIEKNTALYIGNTSDDKVSVQLNLKASNLSMGYKN